MTQEYNKLLKETFDTNIWAEAKQIAKKNPEIITDITGIFDPTPTSDAISTVAGLLKGDFVGAGLSAVSMFPWAGDAIAKPAKFARYGGKIGGMMKTFFKNGDNLAKSGTALLKAGHMTRKQIAAARSAAAAKVRKKLLEARQKKGNCKQCAEFKGKLKMPKAKPPKSKWDTPDGKAPTDGTGTFTKTMPDGSTQSVKYNKGFPNFDSHVHSSGKFDLSHVNGKTGVDESTVFKEFGVSKPPGHTLHHFENGQVGYIPTQINSGFSHTGGGSIVNSNLF